MHPDESRAGQSGEAGRRAPGMRDGCALVTGASRGIGAAIARVLAAEGWPVGVNYSRDKSGAEGVVGEISAAGGTAMALQADVTDPDTPQRLWAALEREFDRPVLALVNNAGVNRDDLVPTLGDEEWQQVIETDLSAAFRLTRHALRPMLRARHGRIVNVSSVVALRVNPGQSNYAAAKAGLIALTKTAAVEVARRGITVNAVAPGLIETQMTEALSKEMLSFVPARRAGTPEEVAACVRFLVSEEASYVTGAVLSVDGGLAA